MRLKTALLFALALVTWGSQAQAQDHPLQIILPREAGTAPDPGNETLSADHFTLWAHPGIEYQMRAAVIGGMYPYTYALSNAPEGMTIDAATGTISWPNPRSSSGPITITVTDRRGAQEQSTWSITVDGTKFRFLDCDAGGSGSGTLADPWRNISSIPANTVADKILYFRSCTAAGNYNALDLPRTGGGLDRVEFNACCWPQQWLAYPGEAVTFDHGYVQGGDVGTTIRFQGQPAALVGFETTNGRHKHFNIIENNHYTVFWKNTMHRLAGIDGVNAAFIMAETSPGVGAQYNVVQNNELYDWGEGYGGYGGSCMKWYAQYKLLLEDNVCRNATGTDEIEGIALKGGIIERATVRGNVIHDVHAHGIGGNQHVLANSEILHNRVYNCGSNCAYFNQDGLIDTTIAIYRNTFVGRVQIDDVGAVAGGLFQFTNNVHVTDDPLDQYFPGTRYVGDSIVDAAQLQVSPAPDEDLSRTPADNCVDADGLLSDAGPDACRTNYLGLKGAELGDEAPSGGTGGASSGSTGTVGAGGASASDDALGPDASGCGCRTTTRADGDWMLLLGIAAFAMAARFRVRRSSGRGLRSGASLPAFCKSFARHGLPSPGNVREALRSIG